MTDPSRHQPARNRPGFLLVLLGLSSIPALLILLTSLSILPSGPSKSPSGPQTFPIAIATVALLSSGLAGYLFLRLNKRLSACRQDLAEQQEFIEVLMESAAGILICDSRGHIDSINEAAARLFGYSTEDLRGTSFGQLLNGGRDPLATLGTSEQRILGIGQKLQGVRKDGTPVHFTLAVTKIRRLGQTHYTAIVHDVSELHRARERAETASRVRHHFLANLSHELRTPLNGILGMTEALRDTPLDAEQSRLLQTLHGSAETLTGHVLRLLDLARLDMGEVTLARDLFCLRELVSQTLQPLAGEASARGLQFTNQLAGDLPLRALGDPARLRQVLTCLVHNAIRFTPQGSVSLRISGVRTERNTTSGGQQAWVLFEVSDTGIGIAPEVQQRMYRPFEQGDASSTRQHGGLGLGLALVARLVKLMGGTIAVESEIGKGSTFRVVVPFSLPEEETTAQAALRPRILVVIAHEEERQAVTDLVITWGWSAVGVGTSQEALAQACEDLIRGAPYSLIVAEGALPDGKAHDLLARLQNWQIRPAAVLLQDADSELPAISGLSAEVMPRNAGPARLREAILRLCSPTMSVMAP